LDSEPFEESRLLTYVAPEFTRLTSREKKLQTLAAPEVYPARVRVFVAMAASTALWALIGAAVSAT
jgi:hypothetical protein